MMSTAEDWVGPFPPSCGTHQGRESTAGSARPDAAWWSDVSPPAAEISSPAKLLHVDPHDLRPVERTDHSWKNFLDCLPCTWSKLKFCSIVNYIIKTKSYSRIKVSRLYYIIVNNLIKIYIFYIIPASKSAVTISTNGFPSLSSTALKT